MNQPLIHCETDTVDTDEHAKDELFKKIAGQISAKLSERSHHSPDYGRSWIGINILEDYGKMQLSNAGLSLYNGNAGIALAIAAQCKSDECNQDEKIKFKIIGDTALKPILSLSKKQSQITSMIESFGLGAMTGLDPHLQLHCICKITKRQPGSGCSYCIVEGGEQRCHH